MKRIKVPTFKGGVITPEHKLNTCHIPIKKISTPKVMTFLMQQGKNDAFVCEPSVRVGDSVLMGQIIGAPTSKDGVPVHSSVSGRVSAVEPCLCPNGDMVKAVVIENNGFDTPAPAITLSRDYRGLDSADIIDVIRKSGIVGFDGIPTHLTLSPKSDTKIGSVIINTAESEPYLTANHRIIMEKPYEIINGLKIILHILSLNAGYIAIEDTKPDAINLLTELANREKDIKLKIVVVKSKHPLNSDLQIVDSVLKRKFSPNQSSADVGTVVVDVANCRQIYRTITFGTSLLHRVVTVSGDCLENPLNVNVRIGTDFNHIFENIGGFSVKPKKVIAGGPLTGIAVSSLDIPVTKTVNALLAFENFELPAASPCIRCSRCVNACPMNLLPSELNIQALNINFENLEKLNIHDCIECGTCSYICPSHRHIVQSINNAKRGGFA